MNPLLPQAEIDRAIAEDRLAAMSEYMGEFREDISEFLPFAVLQALVIKDRKQLVYRSMFGKGRSKLVLVGTVTQA